MDLTDIALILTATASVVNAITPEPAPDVHMHSKLGRFLNFMNMITTIIGLDKQYIRALFKK